MSNKDALRIGVFCGSSTGRGESYVKAATGLADSLSRRGMKLIYGGGSLGLMGILAKRMVENAGNDAVTGIITKDLAKRSGEHTRDTIVVETIEGRKQMMADRSDAFIGLPGAYGTLEEVSGAINQHIHGLGIPIGLLNVDHFYDKLFDFLDHVVSKGFLKVEQRGIIVSDDPEDLLNQLEQATARNK